MRVGQSIKFELFLGRYVDAVVRSVWHDRGLVKLRVEYGRGAFATILSDDIVFMRDQPAEVHPLESDAESDTSF
jgi:hypothetical protein